MNFSFQEALQQHIKNHSGLHDEEQPSSSRKDIQHLQMLTWTHLHCQTACERRWHEIHRGPRLRQCRGPCPRQWCLRILAEELEGAIITINQTDWAAAAAARTPRQLLTASSRQKENHWQAGYSRQSTLAVFNNLCIQELVPHHALKWINTVLYANNTWEEEQHRTVDCRENAICHMMSAYRFKANSVYKPDLDLLVRLNS